MPNVPKKIWYPSKYHQLPDVANDETEAILAEMIAEIESVYGQAYAELNDKANEYLAWFTQEDAKRRKQWQDGVLTTKEYQDWRMRKMFEGRHWFAMSETMATDLVNSDLIAYSIINGYIPEVYALNGNWTAYQIENATQINMSFELFNEQAVERLIREHPDLLPKPSLNIPLDMQWNQQHIQSAVIQSILQGETIDQCAERIAALTDMNQSSSIRTAKTAITSAQNGGRQDTYERAENMGIKMLKRWLATLDGHTRASHRALDGVAIPVDETFDNGCEFPGDPDGEPAEVYNCFLGDTKIASDSEIIRSYKHKYSGEVISIKTSGGVEFTCTPNHPILTLRGWVAAKSLNNGDDILVTTEIGKEVSRRNPNINHAFPSMNTIHNLFNEFGSKRTCVLGVNFHGDIPASDVEIITQKRFLRNVGDSRICDSINKFLFKRSYSTFVRNSSLVEHFRSVRKSSFRNISSKSKLLSIFRRRLRHSEIHGLRPIALLNSGFVEPIDNNASGYSEIISKCLDGFSGIVLSDKIINVNRNFVSTHVYNLQTESGRYFVNSIIPENSKKVNGIFAIAHNCRCRMISAFPDQDFSKFERNSRLEDMSYDDWKDAHGGEPIFKKARNANRDYDMMREYRSLLGSRVPTHIKDFQAIKYGNPSEWAKMKSDARRERNRRRNNGN